MAPQVTVVTPEECQSKPSNTSKRLKPPRIRQPPQHLAGSEAVHHGHGDRPREPPHPPKQPRRRLAPMQRKISQATLHLIIIERRGRIGHYASLTVRSENAVLETSYD